MIFYKTLDITKDLLIALDDEYLQNKEKIKQIHQYALNYLDNDFESLKDKFGKYYHLFLTDNNLTITKTTFKYDKGFSLLFLKNQFLSHQNTIHISHPICEPATANFFSFSDSYQNNKVFQIGYIYHSQNVINLKNQLKQIKKLPFIKDVIIYFIHPKEKFSQKCQILNPIDRKYSLKEMKEDKKLGLDLYKKLQIKNPIFNDNYMYILSKNPVSPKNNIILKIIIDKNYLQNKLNHYEYILFLVAVIFIIVSMFMLYFIDKILKYINEFANKIKNKQKYDKHFNNEFDEVIKSYNETLEELKFLISQKEEFLEFVIHELKTPLSVLSLNIDDNPLNKSSIKMLTNSYNDIVYFLEFNQKKQNIKNINLKKFILDRVEYFSETIFLEDKNIKTNLEEFCIKIDILDIERLIDNNITNSIKHSTSKNIYISLQNGILSFENDGEIKNKEIIFNKFYTTQGFGIGLSIIKNICDKYSIKIALSTNKKIKFSYDLKGIKC